MGIFTFKSLDVTNVDDLQFIYSVRTNSSVAAELFGPPPSTLHDHVKWVNANIDNRNRWIFLCFNGEVCIGYAQIYNFTRGQVEVGWALDPRFQGKGFGYKAVEATINEIASRFPSVKIVTLKVKETNLKAIHIYEKLGFIKTEGAHGIVTMERPNKATANDAQITYLGHAGFVLERKNIKLVCDPWFYGAFYGSWYPRPYNRHLMHLTANATHLYISHGHEDHCDRRFLSYLPKDINIIAANFKNKQMQNLLSDFKHISFLNHLDTIKLDDIAIQMFIDIVSPKNDSAISIDFGYKILDLNDCYIPFESLPKVDMLWSQFSGAFHYPHCYDFSDDIKKQKVKTIRDKYFKDLLSRVKHSGCQIYVPSAGPACFQDPAQTHLNDPDTIYYPWSFFESEFKCNTSVDVTSLVPGAKLIFKNGQWQAQNFITAPEVNYQEETENERKDYYGDHVSFGELAKYFHKLRTDHMHLLKVQSKAFNLAVGNDSYVVVLSPDPFVIYPKDKAPSFVVTNYSFNVPPALMRDILTGGKWDAAFLSNRISLHREVDAYDSVLFQLLYADNDPERTKEIAETIGGSVEMTTQKGWCYQRYCPHAGSDLSSATIENGVIECPRHNWKWDLASGKCLKGGDVIIRSKKID